MKFFVANLAVLIPIPSTAEVAAPCTTNMPKNTERNSPNKKTHICFNKEANADT